MSSGRDSGASQKRRLKEAERKAKERARKDKERKRKEFESKQRQRQGRASLIRTSELGIEDTLG